MIVSSTIMRSGLRMWPNCIYLKINVIFLPPHPCTAVKKCDSELTRLKKSLHHCLPSSLLCREDQLESMRAFLHPRLAEGRPGALYVSGAPGTGKTACLHHLLESSQVCCTWYSRESVRVCLPCVHRGFCALGLPVCNSKYAECFASLDTPNILIF